MRTNAAGVLLQACQHFCIPRAVVALPVCLTSLNSSRPIRPQHGHFRLPVPLIQMRNRITKVLKTQHINIRTGRFGDLQRQRRICLIAITENQVIGVIAPNRIVRDFVILGRQCFQFSASRFRLSFFASNSGPFHSLISRVCSHVGQSI